MTSAADNRTTELREKLTERGVEYVIGYNQKGTSAVETTYFEHDGKSVEFMAWVDADHTKLTAYDLTPEQAIAATLGSDEPIYDELLRCLKNDWNIRASWDGLRKFWHIELTEEGVRMHDAMHGTLTADDVRDLIERHSAWVIGNNRCFHNGAYEEIADELNAKLGSGTCCLHYGEDDDGYDGWYCDECGGWFQAVRRDGHLVKPKHCQECGRKAER